MKDYAIGGNRPNYGIHKGQSALATCCLSESSGGLLRRSIDRNRRPFASVELVNEPHDHDADSLVV